MKQNPDNPTDYQLGTAYDLFARPLTWEQLIAPLPNRARELEIGSGKGLFLQMAAQAHPDRHFIGIEIASKFANRAADRMLRSGLANVTMLRGDAKKFLQEITPSDSIHRVHVYFPDPWWRNKHKKRRVLNDETLLDIQRVLVAGGQFHFWTDVLDYYEHQCEQIMKLTQLTGPRYVPQRAAEHAMDYTTHFERRARVNHQTVYRAIFEKPADA